MVAERLSEVLSESHRIEIGVPVFVYQFANWTFIVFTVYLIMTHLFGLVFYVLFFLITMCIIIIIKLQTHFIGHSRKISERAERVVCRWINLIAVIWHGHEVIGLSNQFPIRPCIYVFHHESNIVNVLYFYTEYKKKYPTRNLSIIGGTRLKGWSQMLKMFHIYSSSCADCVELLEEGNDLCIVPGGSDGKYVQPYEVNWGKKIGFAKIALKTNVPIIPVFTCNIHEAFGLIWPLKLLCKGVKLSFYGGFPVKLITYVGEPVVFNHVQPPYEVAEKTACHLREIIKRHQRSRNRFSAFSQRFKCANKKHNEVLNT